jgi:hypothetical protein
MINDDETLPIDVKIIGLPISIFILADAVRSFQLYMVAVKNSFRNFPPGSYSWISFLNSVSFS